MMLRKRLVEISACMLAVLAHIFLIAYIFNATVGVSGIGAGAYRVVQVALQEDGPSVPKSATEHLLFPGAGVKKTHLITDAPASKQLEIHGQDAELRGERYLDSRLLTQKPLVAIDIPTNFALQPYGMVTQVAILRLLISEYGDVDRVVVEDTVLPEEVREILVATFNKVKFHPGELDGVTVKSQLRIAIRLGDEVEEEMRDAGVK